jgi:hypothetical protein
LFSRAEVVSYDSYTIFDNEITPLLHADYSSASEIIVSLNVPICLP